MFSKENKIKCRRKEAPLLFCSSNKWFKGFYICLDIPGVSQFEEKGSFDIFTKHDREHGQGFTLSHSPHIIGNRGPR
ncbi:hypothetical protein PFDG_04817 [Plasmodium falciparum Dd2]|uniref:Uncharacterized protein n=1 Tax=Plasmodium falciparum (isolate Dd2) TaxID=57267 RepID=A0A0L7M8S0_PLAF4|nr:hypothetical protein PFDG_04817 [Plasmodium falciparum Dd2]